MDLADYRERAEAYTVESGREHRRYFAGLKPALELEPIQRRYAELFEPEAVATLRELAGAAQPGSQRRRVRALLGLAVEGHLATATQPLRAELAQREARARLAGAGAGDERGGGGALGYSQAAGAQAAEPDAGRRAALEQQRLLIVAQQLEPLSRELVELEHGRAKALGWSSYREMCAAISGIDYAALQAQAQRLLAATGDALAATLGPAMRWSAGVDGARHSDLPRFFRCAVADRWYPPGARFEALASTLRALGIDIRRQGNVHVDAAARAGKSPRAFCVPLRVPGEIHLVVPRLGGRDDYVALLHEAGHAEHYAWTDPELPFESRRLGDSSVIEGYAFLFDQLADEPDWLSRHTGASEISPMLGQHARASRLLYVRRYCAKLAFELELRAGAGLGSTPREYAQRLSAATTLAWPEATWLTDLDPLLYAAGYLRAWALAAQLRAMLTSRFGAAWYEHAEAGELLRALWRHGQALGAEELAGAVCDGATLDFEPLTRELCGGTAPAAGAGLSRSAASRSR